MIIFLKYTSGWGVDNCIMYRFYNCEIFLQLLPVFFYFSCLVFFCTWYCWKKDIFMFWKIISSINCICITKVKNLLSDFIFWNILVEKLRWFYYLHVRTYRTLQVKKSYLSPHNFIRFASRWFLTMQGVDNSILHILLG